MIKPVTKVGFQIYLWTLIGLWSSDDIPISLERHRASIHLKTYLQPTLKEPDLRKTWKFFGTIFNTLFLQEMENMKGIKISRHEKFSVRLTEHMINLKDVFQRLSVAHLLHEIILLWRILSPDFCQQIFLSPISETKMFSEIRYFEMNFNWRLFLDLILFWGHK